MWLNGSYKRVNYVNLPEVSGRFYNEGVNVRISCHILKKRNCKELRQKETWESFMDVEKTDSAKLKQKIEALGVKFESCTPGQFDLLYCHKVFYFLYFYLYFRKNKSLLLDKLLLCSIIIYRFPKKLIENVLGLYQFLSKRCMVGLIV